MLFYFCDRKNNSPSDENKTAKADKKEDESMSIWAIYKARSVSEAIQAYNDNCAQCVGNCEDCRYCANTRAFRNQMSRREMKQDLRNPDVREQVRLAMEMG